MRRAIKNLSNVYEEKKTTSSKLAWSLAAANIARLLLHNKQSLAAFKLGHPAIKRLHKLLSSGLDDQQRSAAQFAIGLYYVYVNSIPEELQWLASRTEKIGSLDQGRILLEQVMQTSNVVSVEATRSILFEVPWSTPQQCNYLGVSRQLVTRFPGSADFSLALQGLLVRCGFAGKSLIENKRFRSNQSLENISGYSDMNYANQFELSRIRALVEKGDYPGIINSPLSVETQLQGQYDYALANAYDVAGEIQRSKKLYLQIADNPKVGIHLRKLSRIRINLPYKPRSKKLPTKLLSIKNIETCFNG